MSNKITLEWKGPHSLREDKDRKQFLPPETPGIYIWCVGTLDSLLLSYVGKANDLKNRMYEHMFWMLGGRYCLYGEDHFLEGAQPNPEYKPSFNKLLSDFIKNFDSRSALAYYNLTHYTYFWAVMKKDWNIQRAVESAIIQRGRKWGQPLQNDSLSLRPENSPNIEIKSTFESATFPSALSETIRYGPNFQK